jgi:hypothetical protein
MMRNSGTPSFRALPSITHARPRMVTPEPLTDTFRRTHSFRGPRRLREEGLNLPHISHIWPLLTPRIFLIRSPFWNKHSCWRDGASLIVILTAAIVEMLICTQWRHLQQELEERLPFFVFLKIRKMAKSTDNV